MMDSPMEATATSFTSKTSWTSTDGTSPGLTTAPSRKRSRDESASEIAAVEGSHFVPPEPIPEEPIYGEGMVLLNPSTGRALTAESQTGTWYEDKVAKEEDERRALALERPKLPTGRKSARMSQSSIRASIEDIGAPSPPKSAPGAEIDEATIALGIGWTKMSSEDPDLQAAARGWARYLEVHYGGNIHKAEIMLKNRSLDAYLVGCQEGFYLFTEDLLRGQLVARTWENTLANLKCSPMRFENDEILQAERTPGPEVESRVERINGWQDWDRVNKSQAVAAGGMDMD